MNIDFVEDAGVPRHWRWYPEIMAVKWIVLLLTERCCETVRALSHTESAICQLNILESQPSVVAPQFSLVN